MSALGVLVNNILLRCHQEDGQRLFNLKSFYLVAWCGGAPNSVVCSSGFVVNLHAQHIG